MINKNENKFHNIDEQFDGLINNDNLNINSLEEIMVQDVEKYKNDLNKHIEERIFNDIDEKKLISKKNENGKKKDLN